MALLLDLAMHTTAVYSRAIRSHPHVDTAVVGGSRPRSPAVSLRRSYATHGRHGVEFLAAPLPGPRSQENPRSRAGPRRMRRSSVADQVSFCEAVSA